MFKKIIALMSALVIVGVGVFSSSLVSKASDIPTYRIPAPQPAISDTQGYIILLINVPGSDIVFPKLYFWSMFPDSDTYEGAVYAHIEISSMSFVIRPAGDLNSLKDCYYSVTSVDENGSFGFTRSTQDTAFADGFPGNSIVGWKYAGNVGYCSSASYTNQNFIYYFDESGAGETLTDILFVLAQSRDLSVEISSKISDLLLGTTGVQGQLSVLVNYLRELKENELQGIWGSLEELLDKADLILGEQQKTNTWLEKIFDFLEGSAEKQKQEAQTQGNNSTSQGMNAIEDKGAGFTSSLGGLTSSMSYSGTQCAWEFPEVKLPAIEGVMDEVVLIKKQPIDFAVWVNAIPSDILIVVQSVCTIGLIVFCFKELYGTIEYVLTLRKGGGSDE